MANKFLNYNIVFINMRESIAFNISQTQYKSRIKIKSNLDQGECCTFPLKICRFYVELFLDLLPVNS